MRHRWENKRAGQTGLINRRDTGEAITHKTRQKREAHFKIKQEHWKTGKCIRNLKRNKVQNLRL